MTERRPDATDLRHIVRAFGESSLVELSVDLGGSRLQLSKAGAAQPPSTVPGRATAATGPSAAADDGTTAQAATSPSPTVVELRAPTVGVFRVGRSPDDAPVVEPGSTIAVGDEVGTVHLPNRTVAVRSEVAGTVIECCVEDGGFVEYGQALIRVEVR